jgi:hypothetical protein
MPFYYLPTVLGLTSVLGKQSSSSSSIANGYSSSWRKGCAFVASGLVFRVDDDMLDDVLEMSPMPCQVQIRNK